jgi:tripartite-type tricarboxylate transporter receptor subunit TctC
LNIPTFAESGLPGFELVGWLAAFAPPKTPEAIVRKLNSVLVQVANEPGFKEILANLGTYSAPSSPQELSAFVAAETDKWARIHEAAGIEKQ